MSKLNILLHLNAYQDQNASNNPSQNNWKWNRDMQGIDISEPESKSLSLPAGQSVVLFSGSLTLSSDSTTTWDIALKSGTSNTYRISRNSGTMPEFRTARIPGADATTEITVTKNATLMTLTSSGGTALDLIAGGVTAGDEVRIGDVFNVANRGKFKVLNRTATSLTVENNSGVAEGPVVLGVNFAEQLSIFSADGVQVSDQVDILSGFSPVTLGSYEITDVSSDYIEIFSLSALPSETNVSNDPAALSIYRSLKNLVYIESNRKLEISIDDSLIPNKIHPMNVGTTLKPGIFLTSGPMKKLEITNKSQETADVFYVTAE